MSIILRAKGGKADFPFLPKALVFANGAHQFSNGRGPAGGNRPTQQVGLGATAREDNVRGAFAIAKGRKNGVFGKGIVV